MHFIGTAFSQKDIPVFPPENSSKPYTEKEKLIHRMKRVMNMKKKNGIIYLLVMKSYGGRN